MKQLGLTDARLMKRSKKTRKEQFLEEMNAIIPWQHMLAAVEPHYPKAIRGHRINWPMSFSRRSMPN